MLMLMLARTSIFKDCIWQGYALFSLWYLKKKEKKRKEKKKGQGLAKNSLDDFQKEKYLKKRHA